jgi:DNA-directed RNA polymerase subunit K/omega
MKTSRGYDLDMEKIVSNVGNIFDVTIQAAKIAKKIKKHERKTNTQSHRNPCVTALKQLETE